MSRLTLTLVPLLVGCSSASIKGTLTDGLLGTPLAEVRVIAKASSPDASMSCQAFEGTTGADGGFALEGVCTGTSYSLTLGDDTLWLPEGSEVPDGGADGLALKAWRSTSGSGLYKLTADSFDPLRTHADVKSDKILNSEETVRYPWPQVPGKLPVIEKDAWLVFVSKSTVEKYEILPLIRSGSRKFGDDATWVEMQPWYYVGTRFETDEQFERVAAEIDESKVVTREAGDRAAKYVPGSAVAAGRYVVIAPDSRAVTILDFQEVQTGAEPEKPAEE